MSQPLLLKVFAPVCTGWSKISFIRFTLVRVLIMAARFCSTDCMGSYNLETTSKNIKKVSASREPCIRREAPTTAVVPIPNFKISCAQVM